MDSEDYNEFSISAGDTRKKIVVVSCMDRRINMGLLLREIWKNEDSPDTRAAPQTASDSTLTITDDNQTDQRKRSIIVRNAGGRAQEALRSILISQHFLDATDIHVVHHTLCGMTAFPESCMRTRMLGVYHNDSWANNILDLHPPMSKHGLSSEESVRQDAGFLKRHPLVQQNINVYGWVYGIRSGSPDTMTFILKLGVGSQETVPTKE